jgi:chemotaxis response regulator CheB
MSNDAAPLPGPDGACPLPGFHADAPSFVVGIGASAGGLEALERFFDSAPRESGMAQGRR